MDKPIFMMLVGLPGSSKSTWASNNKEKLNMVVHSSDSIREEFGDVNDQSKNDFIFQTLHSRVKEDLLNGNNVCYDATSLSRKKRVHFINNELRNIPCKKVCVLFATPYVQCLANNFARERQVPEGVIARMIKSFEVPCKQEGWDDIQIVWWDYKGMLGFEYDIFSDLLKWSEISHDNPNHTLNIGDHMFNAYNHYMKSVDYMDRNNILADAILLHDCGKPDVKSFYDSKNNPSETAHYYSHESVSSYKSLFYLREMGYTDEEILYGSLLVGLHMKPFLSWRQSEKAKEKDKRLYGDDIVSAIETIHLCDRAAH